MTLTLVLDSDISTFMTAVAASGGDTANAAILGFAVGLSALGKTAPIMARAIDENGNLAIAGLLIDLNRPLMLSTGTSSHAQEFARLLSAKASKLPGANGPLPMIDAFAESWRTQTGCKIQLSVNLRLFELTKVITPTAPPGSWREANPNDEDHLLRWSKEFSKEISPNKPRSSDEELRQWLQGEIAQKNYFLWEDRGQIVCMVGSNRESAAWRWIAPVYTPLDLRGKGYASALVAKVSQRIVHSGRKCLLFTDLANPTSNSIYQKVGYRPVADFRHVDFV